MPVMTNLDIQPRSENFLERGELDEVVRDTQKQIIATENLRPLQFAPSDFGEGADIAWNVWICRAPVRQRKVH